MTSEKQGRWAGRSAAKDVVRGSVWDLLQEKGVAIGEVWSQIPNFAGADMAAWHLAQTPEWQAASVIKCNPDPSQIPVRLRALYEGKIVYAPVPYLAKEFPYLKLDPKVLKAQGVSFELAATSQGYMQHGERVEFQDVAPLEFCVVGSVAVGRGGGRTGKGAGFADLETGIFRELGIIGPKTPMATTIHSCQLVDDDQIFMQAHDSPLDYVATETELIVTGNTAPRPKGVAWDFVQADQFDTIPFLASLRDRLHGKEPS
jgi:5-formyltetrahydrofolate cyclo-ligase